jgi:predicted dehydrogenase
VAVRIEKEKEVEPMVYRVAVIGAGGVSQSHLQAIDQMDELLVAGIADIDQHKVKETTAAYGTDFYTDYKLMIEKERPHIAVITLPHFLHKEAAVWCANHGCHIMLEKPMAIDLRECDEIMDAAARNDVRLMVGHTQHYIAENRKAREIILSGELGELVMVQDTRHVHYYRPDRPAWFFEKAKSGGGIMMNLGSHSIDKIQWLTDSRIARVRANLSFYGSRGDIEGSGTVYALTDRAVPATISQSGYGGVNRDETEFIFTKGMLKLSTGRGLWISENGAYSEVEVKRPADPFALQFDDLLHSIKSGTDPECSGAYAKSVVAAVEKIYASHTAGKELPV